MVVIDPRVMALITALQETGSLGLADLARSAAEAVERDYARDTEGAPTTRYSIQARAHRQFEAVKTAVENVLSREVAISDRLRSLAHDLKVGDVVLTSPADHADKPSLEVLTDKQRTLAIDDFLKAWGQVCQTVAQRLALDSDGDQG